MTVIDLEEFLLDLAGKFRPGGPVDFNTAIQFHLSGDGGGDWSMKIHEGQCEVSPGIAEGADATLDTSADDFIKMMTGSQEEIGWAFMQGRFNMTGNILPLWRVLAFLRE